MTDAADPFTLRDPRPGDLGWIVARHGALYAEAYGWNQEFEALVAKVVAEFGLHHDPTRERCWIAERQDVNGPENIGSVMLVAHPEREGVAKLRILLVEPSARGLGLGTRLVDTCTEFARAAGYHTISLWTNRQLTAARELYARAGYQLVETRAHVDWGQEQVGETWELAL